MAQTNAAPCFLYHNALADATLVSATLSTGSLTYLHDGLRFTTATFSSFSGSSAVVTATSGAAAATTDAFTRSDENPLATGWTDRGDQALRLLSNAVTEQGLTVLSAGEVRLYTNDTATLTNGRGHVQCDVQVDSISGDTSQNAGVVLYDTSSGAWIAYLQTRLQGSIVSFDGSSTQTVETTHSNALLASTAETVKLSWNGVRATCYAGGSSTTVTPSGLPAGFKPDACGIIQTVSTDTTVTNGIYTWDDFEAGGETIDADAFAMSGQLFQGATGAAVGGTYTLTIAHSDDDVTYTDVTPDGWSSSAVAIGHDGTVILTWDSTGQHRYWRFTFADVDLAPSGEVTLAALCLGRRLDFDEYMSFGFDSGRLKLLTEQNKNINGDYVGGSTLSVEQSVSLKFSQAGLPTTHWHDPSAGDRGDHSRYPSWGHFLKTCWSLNKPWWFRFRAWEPVDGLHCHEGSFYAFNGRRASTSARFIAPTRRDLSFAFSVRSEGYAGDFPLNDP